MNAGFSPGAAGGVSDRTTTQRAVATNAATQIMVGPTANGRRHEFVFWLRVSRPAELRAGGAKSSPIWADPPPKKILKKKACQCTGVIVDYISNERPGAAKSPTDHRPS